MFKNPFSFEGRIRRLEYCLSQLIQFVASIFVGIVWFILIKIGIVKSHDVSDLEFVLFILLCPNIWFMLAQGAKRCHDRNNSGFWQIIPFYSLWMFFADGDIGKNDYGPNPKGINYEDDLNPFAPKPIDHVDGKE